MKEELFVIIDGERKQLDLNTPSGITLNYKSNLFGDISSLKTDYSYTFNLPYTVNNRTILSSKEDLRASATTKVYVAEYRINGCSILADAQLKIEKSSSAEGYESNLVWGTSRALSDLFDKEIGLRDLGKYVIDTPIKGIYSGDEVYDYILDGRWQILPVKVLWKEKQQIPVVGEEYLPIPVDGEEYDASDLNIPMKYFSDKPEGFTYDMSKSLTLRLLYGSGIGLDEGSKIYTNNIYYELKWDGQYKTYSYRQDIHKMTPYPIGDTQDGLGLWGNFVDGGTWAICSTAPLVAPLKQLISFIERAYNITIQLPNKIYNNFCVPFVRMGQPKVYAQQCWLRIYNPYDDAVGYPAYSGNVVHLFIGTNEEFEKFKVSKITKKSYQYDPQEPFVSKRNLDLNCYFANVTRNNKLYTEGLLISGGLGYNTYITGTIIVHIFFPNELWDRRAQRAIAAFIKNPPKLRWRAISGVARGENISDYMIKKGKFTDISSSFDVKGTILGYSGQGMDLFYDMRAETSEVVSVSAFFPFDADVFLYPVIDFSSIKVSDAGEDDMDEEYTLTVDEIAVGVVDTDIYIYKGNTEDVSVSEKMTPHSDTVTPGLIGYFHNLPDINCKDLLQTLCWAAGGFPFYSEKDKVLSVKSFSDLFLQQHNNVLDWSDKIILTKDSTSIETYANESLESKLSDVAKNVYFKMKNVEIDNDGNIKEQEDDKDKYKDSYIKITVNNDGIENTFSTIEVPFNAEFEKIAESPTVSTGKTFKFWEANKVCDLDLGGGGDYRYKKGLLSGLSVKEADPILAKIDWQAVPEEQSPYKEKGWYYPMIKTWQFDEENQEINTYALFLKKIYEDSFVIEEYLKLTELDLKTLDYAIPIYLAKYNSLFCILEVERYDDGISKVTLIKLPMGKNYTIKYEPYIVIMPKNGGYEYNWEDEVWVALKVKANYYRQDAAAPFKSFDVDINADDIKVNFDHKYGSEEWYWDKERHTVVLTANPEATADYHIQLFFEVNIQGDTLDLSNKSVSYNRKYQQ